MGQHHQDLELSAADALKRGDAEAAFRLADRRCRIAPAPEAHSYLLRAEALHRLGDRDEAIADLARAIAAEPESLAANRRLLAWTEGETQAAAARRLVATDRDLLVLRRAVVVLERVGERHFGAADIRGTEIAGWVAWPGTGAADLTIAAGRRILHVAIPPDPAHPLASGERSAAAFTAERPRSTDAQSIRLAAGGDTILSMAAPETDPLDHPPPRAAASDERLVTVIVPVHSDFEATKLCLDRVRADVDRTTHARLVVVDDATPDPRIARYLAGLARDPKAVLLTNPSNLGFVGSVNRGLADLGSGDALLLNADTVPPPGFIERLERAAHSDPGIGIVTALSNNAEITSFPTPGRAAPLAGLDDVLRLDGIARAVNAGRLVDLPSATGFCLYITRPCLDAVGRLSAEFHRGYFEDADLCLRAAAHGFRSVCDTSIYVGHAGSRSFGPDKAALAARNFATLAKRHPDYLRRSLAFAAADPLRPARAAIEAEAIGGDPTTHLIVVGGRHGLAAAEARAAGLARLDRRPLIAKVIGGELRLFGLGGAIPQSLGFAIDREAGRVGLRSFLERIEISAVDVVGADGLPADLAETVLGLGLAFDFVVADGTPLQDGGVTPPLIGAARRIIAPSRRALGFARDRADASLRTRIVFDGPVRAMPARPHLAGEAIGILSPEASVEDKAALVAFVDRVAGMYPVVVVGGTADDLALIARGAAVTGRVAPAEFARLVERYRIGALVLDIGTPYFGHPLVAAAESLDRPIVFRDFGRDLSPSSDLACAPAATASEIAEATIEWLRHARHTAPGTAAARGG